MPALREWIYRLWGTLRRNSKDRELEEELRMHLELASADMQSRGGGPDDARRAAKLEFGGVTQAMESLRDQRGVPWIDDLFCDLRYGLRTLRRSPGFATLAIMIVALGIGANTSVFSILNAVLLKPLPYRDAGRIVTLSRSLTAAEPPDSLMRQVSIREFRDWQQQSSSFDSIAYYAGPREGPATSGSTAEYARIARVSPEFFRVFGVEPAAGRFFTGEEMKQGSGGALMISHAYWQSHFGGDPRALGRSVRMYGRAMTIAGVLPPDFRFPNNTDLWYPTTMFQEPEQAQNYLAVGRLKPGVSFDQARTEMDVIGRRVAHQYPETGKDRSVALTRVRDDLTGNVRSTLLLLFGAVTIVLLIACANTATLLLGRAAARTREVAVRAVLGAGRRRIVRQLLTESALLAFLGGASGLLLAHWGSKAFVALAPADLPRLTEGGIDRWVLAFTLGVSTVTSLLFGLVPGFYASKVDLNGALKQYSARPIIGGPTVRIRGVLAASEIALAVVLLSASGLLIKSFVALNNVPLGFHPEHVLVMRATGPGSVRDANLFFKDMLAQIATLPGVSATGATMRPPGHVDSSGSYYIDHLPAQRDPAAPMAVNSVVAPGTFAALGIPLKSGRDFNDGDIVGRTFVAVVNEALVRRSFHGEDPIGRVIFCPFDASVGMTIIGVVGDVRQRGPSLESMPECYMPNRQHRYNDTTLSIVTRTAADPNTLAEVLRRLAHERSPDVPVTFTTMEAIVSETVAAPRFRALLFALFAAVAVSLALAGVYGVMAFAVGQRSGEIGVRMALGASTGSVLRLVLRQGLVLACVGLTLGIAAAAASTRLLTAMLYQVKPNDPAVYVAVALALGTVALLASYIPARRASRIDPLAALRQE
jgi:predicted permease